MLFRSNLRIAGVTPDLLVCKGRYYTLNADRPAAPGRWTSLHWRHSFRRSMLLGSTPPHQATLVGPGARQCVDSYSKDFQLAADLDYFLRLSRHRRLQVKHCSLELVHLGDGGVSGQRTKLRLAEVRRAYTSAFGWLWWIPFLLRYGQRLLSRVAARTGESQP